MNDESEEEDLDEIYDAQNISLIPAVEELDNEGIPARLLIQRRPIYAIPHNNSANMSLLPPSIPHEPWSTNWIDVIFQIDIGIRLVHEFHHWYVFDGPTGYPDAYEIERYYPSRMYRGYWRMRGRAGLFFMVDVREYGRPMNISRYFYRMTDDEISHLESRVRLNQNYIRLTIYIYLFEHSNNW